MKIQNRKKMLGLSLVTAMLLTSSAYSAQIVGADVNQTNPYADWAANTQFGFGGLNLENVTVNMVTADGNTAIDGDFNPDTGMYPQMALGDSYESSVFSSGDTSVPDTRLGYITQKIWPISEPTGIKVINNDLSVSSNGKPMNCIMASSYLGAEDKEVDPTTYYLNDAEPKPTLCGSYAGSSKRFQLVLNENVVAGANPGEYGQYVDLVFNIDPATEAGDHRYQVFQKVSNFTGMRLDGFKIEVLNANGDAVPSDLNISLGLGEKLDHDGLVDPADPDLWPDYEMAFYPPGLWGDGTKEHLPIGWFDVLPSGYKVSVDAINANTITSGDQLSGNYVKLFGNWQPEKWVPLGMHEVIDPLEEPVLIAYWGTTPDETFDDAPAWHYGMNHDNPAQSWATPSQDVLDMWAAQPEKYVIDDIEDIPNLSLNYIVNVGENIDNNFTIRITPKVSVDQTAPSYIEDDNITYIPPTVGQVPPTADAGPDVTVQVNKTVTITGTGTDIDGTIASYEWKYGTTVVATTASFNFTPDTVGTATLTLTVTDNDGLTATDSMNLTVTAEDDGTPTDPDDGVTPPDDGDDDIIRRSSGGGGCTYNPNSKNFDMTFLLMMALGLLYPFRRRFIK